MGRVFVIKAFGRWAADQDISDARLLDAIDEADRGIIAAHLGGDLVKLRIARAGQGKSGGYRTVVAFRREDRAFFLDGWGKNDRENVDAIALRALKALAERYLALDASGIQSAIDGALVREVCREIFNESSLPAAAKQSLSAGAAEQNQKRNRNGHKR